MRVADLLSVADSCVCAATNACLSRTLRTSPCRTSHITYFSAYCLKTSSLHVIIVCAQLFAFSIYAVLRFFFSCSEVKCNDQTCADYQVKGIDAAKTYAPDCAGCSTCTTPCTWWNCD